MSPAGGCHHQAGALSQCRRIQTQGGLQLVLQWLYVGRLRSECKLIVQVRRIFLAINYWVPVSRNPGAKVVTA
jgi:hypothetical protein